MDGAAVEDDVTLISFALPGAENSPRQNAPARKDFVAGPENRLASRAVDALLQPGEHCYSPVVFCGPPGTGKSHLAHAVAAAHGNAVLVDGADFARDLAAAIDRNQEREFRQRYRGADMVVLDGLAQLAGRRAALREFVHTMDVLEAREVPVVVTSKALPGEMAELPPALRSRLSGGLVVPLAPPGVAARQAIVRRAAADRSVSMSPAAVKLLAESLNLNAAALESALTEFMGGLFAMDHRCAVPSCSPRTHGTIEGNTVSIDVDDVRCYLATRRTRSQPSLKRITALVAKFYGLRPSQLCGPSRRRPLVLARSVAIYLARVLTGSSFEALGRYFGGRDHTTALHSCQTVQRCLANDTALRDAVQALQRILAG